MLGDEDPMPFGPYRGMKMADVPPDYLLIQAHPETHTIGAPGSDARMVADYVRSNIAALEFEAREQAIKFGECEK